jgi:hypothetical protein
MMILKEYQHKGHTYPHLVYNSAKNFLMSHYNLLLKKMKLLNQMSNNLKENPDFNLINQNHEY